MTHCKEPNCKFEAWRGRLCYKHWRESRGFTFDPRLKVFVKARDLAACCEIEDRASGQSPAADLYI